MAAGGIVSSLTAFRQDWGACRLSSCDNVIGVCLSCGNKVRVFESGGYSNSGGRDNSIARIRCTSGFILDACSSLCICSRNSFYSMPENFRCRGVYCGIYARACSGSGHVLKNKVCSLKAEVRLTEVTITCLLGCHALL